MSARNMVRVVAYADKTTYNSAHGETDNDVLG